MPNEQLSDTFEIKIDGKGRDIFMSFGLLSELAQTVNHIGMAPQIPIDHELRDAVLKALLAERSPSGKVVTAVDPVELAMAPDAVLALLEWAGNHVTDFFLKALRLTAKINQRGLDAISALQSSSAGSEA